MSKADEMFKNKYLQQPISLLTQDNLEMLKQHCYKQLHRETGQILKEHEIVLEMLESYKKQQVELEKKNKMIQKMSHHIATDIKKYCYSTCFLKHERHWYYECSRDCEEYIKQYFERKVEEE